VAKVDKQKERASWACGISASDFIHEQDNATTSGYTFVPLFPVM
jgi:hypothetical protein